MRVCTVFSELSPWAATGGLGEVSQSLPDALHGHYGLRVSRIVPLYRQIAESGLDIEPAGCRLQVPHGPHGLRAEIWKTVDCPPSTYFVRRDEFFDRSGLYGIGGRDYEDNFDRFVFFQKAAVMLMDTLKLKPHIVHLNDWQTGLVPWYLRYGVDGCGRRSRERSLFAIHNLAYQGIFPGERFLLTNLPYSCFGMEGCEFFGQVNLLKAGLTGADVLVTVSPGYAREIQTPRFGCGLDGVLRRRNGDLHGIMNGIDDGEWNPGDDPLITSRYSLDNLAGKRRCKRDLLADFGLSYEPGRPLAGMVNRLSEQKGVPLLDRVMPELISAGFSLVVLGTGDPHLESVCLDWARRWPDRVGVRIGFDNMTAHRVQAGADVNLMPSKYEPCGLSQLFSLRYGTVPIVHATGGLKDSIRRVDHRRGQGNGFTFEPYTVDAFADALHDCSRLFAQRRPWLALVRRIMREDHSWRRAAGSYVKLYRQMSP